MFKSKSPKISIAGDRDFRVEEDIVYTGKCGDFTVPAGFITDLASVPAPVTWLIPSYGKYTLAAIVHDYLCVELGKQWKLEQMRQSGLPTIAILIKPPASARDTDGIFRRIMRELEVPFLRRWLMWTGVRWGALFNPARREGIVKDLPMMMLWSIIASPVVVPATVIVTVGLIIDKVFEALVGRLLT